MHSYIVAKLRYRCQPLKKKQRDCKSAHEILFLFILIKSTDFISFIHLEIISCCVENNEMWGAINKLDDVQEGTIRSDVC